MSILSNPAAEALNQLSQAPIVRFSLLALSSIFFLVDPFAAIPSFLAITETADALRRKRMARKGALTAFIVLTTFAVAGQLIFKMFGITLPAFEIAGGLILLLIGLDMLEARRSPRRKPQATPKRPLPRKTPALCPWESPCSPARAPSPPLWCWWARCLALALGDGCNSWLIAITALVSYWVLAGASRCAR